MSSMISALHLVSPLNIKHVAIGPLEMFHYYTHKHEAHFYWSHYFDKQWDCKIRPAAGAYSGGHRYHGKNSKGAIIGPYPMLKGPLFFIDTNSTRRVLENEWVRNEWHQMLTRSRGAPWDDVFIGMALSMASINLTFVNTIPMYSEYCTGSRNVMHHKPCPHMMPFSKQRIDDIVCNQGRSNSCSGTNWTVCKLKIAHTV